MTKPTDNKRKEQEDKEEEEKDKEEEEEEEEAKLCLDESGRVFALGNKKLNYDCHSEQLLFKDKAAADVQLFDKLLRDCKKVFTAKQTLETESYSSGSTFWIPYKNNKNNKNNTLTGLERLALTVFERVTKGLKISEEEEDSDFDASKSGCEWWTQVIDSRDDIVAHFDKDYYLEENMNVSVYPQVATVTYFCDIGAPTIVANRVRCLTYFDEANPKCTNDILINESNKNDDKTFLIKKDDKNNKRGKKSCDDNNNDVYISWPKIGKLTTFDGRCLHAAPSALSGFSDDDDESDESDDDDDDDDSDDSDDDSNISTKRITFLVNVWLNHKPILSETLPDEVRASLECKGEDFEELLSKARNDHLLNEKNTTNNNTTAERSPLSQSMRKAKLAFKHCEENLVYEYSAPKFCFEKGPNADCKRFGRSLLISSAAGILKRDF